MTATKFSDDGESQGGAPTDGVGAPGDVEDVTAAREGSLSHNCIIQEEKEKKKGTLHRRRALPAAAEARAAPLGVCGARAREGVM
jgi:hypothetical protein